MNPRHAAFLAGAAVCAALAFPACAPRVCPAVCFPSVPVRPAPAGHVDANPALADVQQALHALPPNGDVLKGPDGLLAGYDRGLSSRHFQGVQPLAAGTYMAVTGSAGSDLFVVPVSDASGAHDGRQAGRLALHPQFAHAGGLQAIGDVLVVALERGTQRRCGQGLILFVDISRPDAPRLLPTRISRVTECDLPFHPACSAKPMNPGTASVAIVRTGQTYLLVAGRWGSQILDFYESTGSDLHQAEFVYEGSWCSRELEVAADTPPGYARYQNLSLVATADGQVYLLGFANMVPKLPGSHMDVFEVTAAHGRRRLRKIGRQKFDCGWLWKSQCEFRGAAGAHVDDQGRLSVYATAFRAKSPEELRYVRFGPKEVQR